jgi:flagellar export protein FliJ
VARFKFRLESLMKFRKDRLIASQKDYADLNNDYLSSKNKLRNCVRERAEMLTYMQRNPDDIASVKLFSELVRTETIRIGMLDKELLKKAEELDRMRRWVEHLHRELKVVENLEKKQRENFEKEERKKERKQIDGWVVERWNRS